MNEYNDVDKQPFRFDEKPEKIENFHAHSGECKYCGGIVKMKRDDKSFQLILDGCWCLLCGQRYYVETDLAIDAFDRLQWEQKSK